MLYEAQDYKEAIRARLKELKARPGRYTLKRMAEAIPIQYTYLSKALNDPDTHVNPDHLFSIAQFLKWLPEEIEFLYLLHERATCRQPDRATFLDKRIERIKKTRLLRAPVAEGESAPVREEIAYLLDPVTVVVHVALSIPAYLKSPQKLASQLGLTPERMQEILRKLSRSGLIEMASDTVLKVHNSHVHYSPNHPLMRSHQELMRALSHGRMLQLSESDKRSFMVTFSADPTVVEEMRRAFDELVRRFEAMALNSRQQNAYQLNFELFRWV